MDIEEIIESEEIIQEEKVIAEPSCPKRIVIPYQPWEGPPDASADYGEEYQRYLKDQKSDGLGTDFSVEYLDFFTEKVELDYPNLKVLEIWPGQFLSYGYFVEKFCNEIIGIDICEAALDRARQEELPIMVCDPHIMNREFIPEAFDLVLAFHAFEHMYDLPRVIRNCYKILKPRGHLFFSIPMPSYNWKRGHWYDIFGNEEMIKLLRDGGFKVQWEFLSRDGMFRAEQEMIGCAIRM